MALSLQVQWIHSALVVAEMIEGLDGRVTKIAALCEELRDLAQKSFDGKLAQARASPESLSLSDHLVVPPRSPRPVPGLLGPAQRSHDDAAPAPQPVLPQSGRGRFADSSGGRPVFRTRDGKEIAGCGC